MFEYDIPNSSVLYVCSVINIISLFAHIYLLFWPESYSNSTYSEFINDNH